MNKETVAGGNLENKENSGEWEYVLLIIAVLFTVIDGYLLIINSYRINLK